MYCEYDLCPERRENRKGPYILLLSIIKNEDKLAGNDLTLSKSISASVYIYKMIRY